MNEPMVPGRNQHPSGRGRGPKRTLQPREPAGNVFEPTEAARWFRQRVLVLARLQDPLWIDGEIA